MHLAHLQSHLFYIYMVCLISSSSLIITEQVFLSSERRFLRGVTRFLPTYFIPDTNIFLKERFHNICLSPAGFFFSVSLF